MTKALDESLAGRGQILMLAGEPGIGKTRTAQELAKQAEHLGSTVLWSWCPEDAGVPPYWPWAQLLRAHLLDRDVTHLRQGPGSDEEAISTLLAAYPDLVTKLPAPQLSPPLDPEQARFRLFESVSTFLNNAAKICPLTLIFDDLQWADHSSLQLLEFFSRTVESSAILVLGTYRDTEITRNHSLSQTLGNLVKGRNFARVQLRGLDLGEVEELFQNQVSPRISSRALVAAIHERTEGNPLFVSQVFATLDPEELGDAQQWRRSIPEGIRDAIGRHLNRLSEECNRVLVVASVVGLEFDLQTISMLSEDFSEERLLVLLDEALKGHILEEIPGGPDRYRFVHSLVQHTLSDELSTSRRVRLHAQIGTALEQRHGEGAALHAGELAYHFAEAEPIMGAGKLIEYSLLAGQRSLTVHAPAEALAHFQRGIEAVNENTAEKNVAILWFGLAQAQIATLPRERLKEATDSLTHAFEIYAAAGMWDDLVEVLQSPYNYATMRRLIESEGLVIRALELLPSSSLAYARALCLYGSALGRGEIPGRHLSLTDAKESFEQALQIARSEGDHSLEFWILANLGRVCWWHLQWSEALAICTQAIDSDAADGDARSRILARRYAMFSQVSLGNLASAREHAEAELLVAESTSDLSILVSALWDRSDVSRFAGEWTAAREYGERGLNIDPLDPRLLVSRTLMEYELGHLEQAVSYQQMLLNVLDRSRPWWAYTGYARSALTLLLALVSRISGEERLQGRSESAAQDVLANPTTSPGDRLYAHCGLGLLAFQRKDSEAAAEQYRALCQQQGTLCTLGVSIDHLLALLARTFGELEAAASHFDNAIAFCRKAGFLPELAWTLYDYADALLSSGGEQRHDRAEGFLHQPRELTQSLSMVSLQRYIDELPAKHALVPSQSPANVAGLSDRELEVIRLIAAGKSNQEIADVLVISLRTVGNHVSNILAKTNSANRVEAATYALRNGLL